MEESINQIWHEICYLLRKKVDSETDFQKEVVNAFRELQYKKSLGEIEEQFSIHSGTGKVAVDILIKHEKKEIFIIEVKKQYADLIEKNRQQLFSYMKLLKLDYGILIGKTIQIFHDEPEEDKKNNNPILIEKIEINKENSKGQLFVEAFLKVAKIEDLKEKLKNYKENCLKQKEKKEEDKNLKQEILNLSIEDLQKIILEKYQSKLSENSQERIKKILEGIEIELILKDKESNFLQNEIHQKNNHQNSFNSSSEEKRTEYCKPIGKNTKIGEYVQETFKDLFNKNIIPKEEIENLLDKEYSKKTFDLNYPFLANENTVEFYKSKGNNKNTRYFSKKNNFYDGYYLCSQWVEKHWYKFRTWEKKIKNQ